jgi:7-cyano-7-deazaguanine tRNA-ribosyltransferase
MVLALAVLMGCDLFDSASYAKFARDDRMMFIDGTYRLQDMQSLDCSCPACRGNTLEKLKKMNAGERTKTIARHNLYQIKDELALVKRYVREGRLWELVEIRCRSHPAMLDALRRLEEHGEFLERYDPVSRDGALFYTGAETRGRPVFGRYISRIMERYVPETEKAALFYDEGSKPYGRAMAADFDRVRRAGYTPVVISPFGPVPAELDEIYPIAQSVFPKMEDMDTVLESESSTVDFLECKFSEAVSGHDIPDDGIEEYDADLIRAKAVSRYQFGIDATNALFKGKIELVISKNTGKIRNVISDGEHVLSMRAGDGLYTLRKEGADRIASAVPAPFMRVRVNDDAVPFVSDGRNVFCQFVTGCDDTLKPMDEVMVTDEKDKVIATGRMILVADEIRSFKKGVAVKVRSGSGDEA